MEKENKMNSTENMFVVSMQALENYGAHCEDGLNQSGNAQWKFKSGSTYLVSDVDRPQNAMAFVMAAFSENDIGWKEFPTSVEPFTQWMDQIEEDHADSQDDSALEFYTSSLQLVSPLTGKKTTKDPLSLMKSGWLEMPGQNC